MTSWDPRDVGWEFGRNRRQLEVNENAIAPPRFSLRPEKRKPAFAPLEE